MEKGKENLKQNLGIIPEAKSASPAVKAQSNPFYRLVKLHFTIALSYLRGCSRISILFWLEIFLLIPVQDHQHELILEP